MNIHIMLHYMLLRVKSGVGLPVTRVTQAPPGTTQGCHVTQAPPGATQGCLEPKAEQSAMPGRNTA